MNSAPYKMHLATTLLVSCLTFPLVCHELAAAGLMPENPRPAEKTLIEKIYKGSSWQWSNGGAYHSPDGKMVGKWFANGSQGAEYVDVIGHGRWQVNSKGTLCHDAEWRWRRKEQLRKRFVRDCWKHVVDEKGNLWQHDQRHGWYPFPKYQIRSGDRFTKRYNRISRKNNLWGG